MLRINNQENRPPSYAVGKKCERILLDDKENIGTKRFKTCNFHKKQVVPVKRTRLFWVLASLLCLIITFNPSSHDRVHALEKASNPVRLTSINFMLYGCITMPLKDGLKKLRKVEPTLNKDNLFDKLGTLKVSFADLGKELGLQKPGFLRLRKDKIQYDEISSMNVLPTVAGDIFIELIGKTGRIGESGEEAVLLDVELDFPNKYNIRLNNLVGFKDAALEAKLIPEIAAYLERKFENRHRIYFSTNKDFTDYRQELTANFYIKLFKVGQNLRPNFLVIKFEPKRDKDILVDFTVFIIEGKIVKYGYYFDLFGFELDNQWYLVCDHADMPHSGAGGRILFSVDQDGLRTVLSDYTFSN